MRLDTSSVPRMAACAIAVVMLVCIAIADPEVRASELDWPAVTNETKPWTRWWWHGSAVTESELTIALEKYAAAGLGGLELTPIYGVRGEEAEFIEYLSPRWMDMLEHVLQEARRLDIGVDMATGTGWPFGGPWVGADAACKNLVFESYELAGGQSLDHPVRHVQRPMARAIGRRVEVGELDEKIGANEDLQALALDQVRFEKPLPLVALMAFGGEEGPINLTDLVDDDGRLAWTAPQGHWTLYAVFQGWHGKMVERAAPGGEGNVIDHFSREALKAYLAKFDQAFESRDLRHLRAFFNDSYEVDDAAGNADFTPHLFAEFERRRGYDLRAHLPALFGKGTEESNARILCDFRETVSDLLLDEFTIPWTTWAHGRDALTRNQAHGSPANILDLYAASDIPETEGTDRIQFLAAASAAHIAGKPLVSAEAATWLDEHFIGTLAETKRWIDNYFLGGVNHICYHGTCFSPEADAWPGRLFYASVELQPSNPQWTHFHALNDYVARCQSFLQMGTSDSDVAVYYPIHDEWSRPGHETLVHFSGEMNGTATRRCASRLLDAGYLLTFASDRQLANAKVADGRIAIGEGRFRALVLPSCHVITEATLAKIVELAEAGATVVAAGQLPTSAAGMHGSGDRQGDFEELIARLRQAASLDGSGPSQADEAGVLQDLARGQIAPERELIAGGTLKFTRRRLADGLLYFIVNSSQKAFDAPVRLAAPAQAVALFDPVSGRRGLVELDRSGSFRLGLAPGESRLLRTFSSEIVGPSFSSDNTGAEPIELAGNWRIQFLEGGPAIPAAIEGDAPGDWTQLGDD
ncbi:MAG TPA: glycosyl hydrolase, partial [Lacipirellulaceae bacterium]|nr:glycosyl hydrolase [Lacipirellulaceae bacterium]